MVSEELSGVHRKYVGVGFGAAFHRPLGRLFGGSAGKPKLLPLEVGQGRLFSLLDNGCPFLQPLFDLVDPGMRLLDEIVLNAGQLPHTPALVPQLIQQKILFDGKPFHSPGTNSPANGSGAVMQKQRLTLLIRHTIVNCTLLSMMPVAMA
jgi:hypothetical protein